jgi:hypothetical protein
MGVKILAGLIEGKINPEYIASCRVRPQDYMGAAQEHDPKILLTRGEDGKLKALAEGKDGRLKTVDPTKENADSFLKIDPLDLNRLDWKEVNEMGLSGQSLQDALKAMAYGHKSPGLLEIRMEINGKVYEDKARLSLEPQPDGTIRIQTHPYQEKPDFEKPFMGVMFTPDEQKQLTATGHGGRVFELETTPGGEKVPSLVSLDKITNRIKAVPFSEIQIPKVLKGVELSQEQQDGLRAGKGVLVEDMEKKQRPGEEAGRIRHTSLPPEQWKEVQAKKQAAQPAEGFKTQVAVNNEGKTNEATKHSSEPLQKGQTQPTGKQAEKKEEKKQEQRQSPAKPRKSAGHKM